MEQAGAGAALECRVRTVAQKKYLLKVVKRPVDRSCACERTVVATFSLPCAAVLPDLGKGMIRCDMDVRKRLVVPEQHVVAGLELLDEVLLQQQRFGLGAGRKKHH